MKIAPEDIDELALATGCLLRLYRRLSKEPEDMPGLLQAQFAAKRMLDHAQLEYTEATHRQVVDQGEARYARDPVKGWGVLLIEIADWITWLTVREPVAYQGLRLQFAMGITGKRWGAYVLYYPQTGELRYWDEERHDEEIAALEKTVDAFSRFLLDQQPPPKLRADDDRCKGCAWRRSCQGFELRRLIAEDPRAEDIDNPALDVLANDYAAAERMVAAAEEARAIIKQRVIRELNGAGAVETAQHRVYFNKIPVLEHRVRAHQREALRVYPV